MLNWDGLVVSSCPGVGKPISMGDARRLAEDLIKRRLFEEQESELVKQQIKACTIPSGSLVVIDIDGLKTGDGTCYRRSMASGVLCPKNCDIF